MLNIGSSLPKLAFPKNKMRDYIWNTPPHRETNGASIFEDLRKAFSFSFSLEIMTKQAEKANWFQIHIYSDLSSIEVIASSMFSSMRFPQGSWERSANWISIDPMEKTNMSSRHFKVQLFDPREDGCL